MSESSNLLSLAFLIVLMQRLKYINWYCMFKNTSWIDMCRIAYYHFKYATIVIDANVKRFQSF